MAPALHQRDVCLVAHASSPSCCYVLVSCLTLSLVPSRQSNHNRVSVPDIVRFLPLAFHCRAVLSFKINDRPILKQVSRKQLDHRLLSRSAATRVVNLFHLASIA
jgi:hypothetical protein